MSTLLNKPYDAFADEGDEEEDVQVEVKKSKQSRLVLLVLFCELDWAEGGWQGEIWGYSRSLRASLVLLYVRGL